MKKAKPAMNPGELERGLALLVKPGDDTVKAKDRVYSGRLIEGVFSPLVERRGYDDLYVEVDFKKRTIKASTWLESHHNGDYYAREDEDIAWKELDRLRYPIFDTLTKQEAQKIRHETEEQLMSRARDRARDLLKVL